MHHQENLKRGLERMNLKKFVENLNDDELNTLAQRRNLRDWENHVGTLGPIYFIRIHFGEEIEKLMLELQKRAYRELEKLHTHVIEFEIQAEKNYPNQA